MMKRLLLLLSLSLMTLLTIPLDLPAMTTSWPGGINQQRGDSTEISFTVLLIGDARRAFLTPSIISFLEYHIGQLEGNSAVIFLGDNVHPSGLPDSSDKGWDVAHKSLIAQLQILRGFQGRPIFIPGNHDWANGREDGLERMVNQREFIEHFLGRQNVFLPEDGSPGPVEILLTDDLVMILLDSHWWFHENSKNYSGINDEDNLLVQIDDAIRRYPYQKIIFATHFPLFSAGTYGGHFPWQDYIFPLRNLHPGFWIPLPGFIYTSYRKCLGSRYDIANPHYQALKRSLTESFKRHDNLIYVAGHEHNLQYTNVDNIHHIISGSAGAISYVSTNTGMEYAQSSIGIARLDFMENGEVWLTFYYLPASPSLETGPSGNVGFRKMLFSQRTEIKQNNYKDTSVFEYHDSLIVISTRGEKFKAGNLKRALLGNNYRKEWNTPVEVPVFNLDKVKGGMQIVKKGGGDQTRSLRLVDQYENQWVLRSLDKYPAGVIPEAVRVKMAEDIVKDQMSASLPYAALSIPVIAEAAGVNHTNPEIYFLPHHPSLKPYLEDIPEGLYLLEERPDWKRAEGTGFADAAKIFSTNKMLEKVHESHVNTVDQRHYLRTRLVDMLISDWDRHEDQWRWAAYNEEGKTVFRAIPRDRDMAFYLSEGLLIKLSARSPYLRKMQGLDYKVKDIRGLNWQARHLDRRFLNELTLNDWLEIAEDLKGRISDSVIYHSINAMPASIAAISGEMIASRLKSRRCNLTGIAENYYMVLNKTVDIVGTDQKDIIIIERINEQFTKVSVYGVTNDTVNSLPYYHRLIENDHTAELHIFGLNGNDEFRITGEVDKGIKLKIIPGKGKDRIFDNSSVRGFQRQTRIYDKRTEAEIKGGDEIKAIWSNDQKRYNYQYDAFEYNQILPLILAGYHLDDGLSIGAGSWWRIYGFMKAPYKSQHRLIIKYAGATGAKELSYYGNFVQLVNDWNVGLNLHYSDPKHTINFYGFGNESLKINQDPDYYRVRTSQILINPELNRKVGRFAFLSAGVLFESDKVENTPGRYISDISENGLDPDIFRSQQYSGFDVGFKYDSRDNEIFPVKGIHWLSKVRTVFPLENPDKPFLSILTESGFFISYRRPYRFIVAMRAGAAMNIGPYQFYQANSLGGDENLRGYRNNRYTGDAVFFQNTELRIRLWQVKSYISKGHFGLLFFNDIGHVWYANQTSHRWHHGYGGGLWVSPFGMAIINVLYELSVDEPKGLFSIRFGFLF